MSLVPPYVEALQSYAAEPHSQAGVEESPAFSCACASIDAAHYAFPNNGAESSCRPPNSRPISPPEHLNT